MKLAQHSFLNKLAPLTPEYKLTLVQIIITFHHNHLVVKDCICLFKMGNYLNGWNKQLKRAACLGRMATIMKWHAPSLQYLKQVKLL